MRILQLTPELPERRGTGGARRNWEIVVGLAARGHQVTVASVARADQHASLDALRDAGVEVVVATRPEPRWREAVAGCLRSPGILRMLAQESFYGSQAAIFATELRGPINAWLASGNRPHLVMIEHDWAMRQLSALLPAALPTFGGFHNITAKVHERAVANATGLNRRFQAREARLQAHDLERLPASMIAGSACSQAEANEITARTSLPCVVVPNGADVDALASIPTAGGAPGSLLFSGSLGYPPNADAAVWLATEVLPRVRDTHPDARLTIVGPGAPERVEELASSSVDVAGFVPDLEPYLARAAVYLAGIRSGAGTKLKVVEALAAGRAIVTTSVGAEGLDLVSGTHALIADSTTDFVAAVRRLLDDPALAVRLARAGRQHAQARFSWHAAVDALEKRLNEIALTPGALDLGQQSIRSAR